MDFFGAGGRTLGLYYSGAGGMVIGANWENLTGLFYEVGLNLNPAGRKPISWGKRTFVRKKGGTEVGQITYGLPKQKKGRSPYSIIY